MVIIRLQLYFGLITYLSGSFRISYKFRQCRKVTTYIGQLPAKPLLPYVAFRSLVNCCITCVVSSPCSDIFVDESRNLCYFDDRSSVLNKTDLLSSTIDHFHLVSQCEADGHIFNATVQLCFDLFIVKLNWTETVDFCNRQGGRLAVLDSTNKIQYMYEYTTTKYPNVWYWYLGASDAIQEGEWKWLNGESAVGIIEDATLFNIQDCAALRNQEIRDVYCNVSRQFICEWEYVNY